jgi:hypothetical protein
MMSVYPEDSTCVNIIFFCFVSEIKMIRRLVLLVFGATMVVAQRRLALPDPRSCANSKYTQISLT